jgi:hypothetical protein
MYVHTREIYTKQCHPPIATTTLVRSPAYAIGTQISLSHMQFVTTFATTDKNITTTTTQLSGTDASKNCEMTCFARDKIMIMKQTWSGI